MAPAPRLIACEISPRHDHLGGEGLGWTWQKTIGLPVALVASAIIAAGCIVEPPYTSGSTETSVSVTLTAAEPVAVFDVAVDSSDLPRMASVSPYVLRFSDVDSRVRVASFPEPADVGDVLPIASIRRPTLDRDVYVDIPTSGGARFIVELTDPRAEDVITVAGTLRVPFGYPGTPAPDAKVTVTGLDTPELRARPDVAITSVVGPRAFLDADHPVALVPLSFVLTSDSEAAPRDLASETRFVLAPDIPDGAAVPTLYYVSGDGADARMNSTQINVPITRCALSAQATCETALMVRWQWTGLAPRVDLRYDVVTTLVEYDGRVNSSVQTAFGDPIEIRAGARPIAADLEGSLEVAGSDRTNAWFRLSLAGAPSAPAPDVMEVPGVLIMTYAARGSDGRTDANTTVPLRFRDANFFRSTPASIPEVLDLVADGVSRTVAIPIFAHCQPDADCTLDFWLELFGPRGADVGPVTVTYRFDARVTAFSGTELPVDASLTLAPKPSDAP